MACLDDYILIKSQCGSSTPTSGLYIDTSLPGITLERAANTAEGALPTGVLLLEQSIQNGIARVRQELVTALLPKVRFNQLISGGEYGTWNPDTIASDSAYLANSSGKGVAATLKGCCRLANMYIPRVGIISKTTYPINQITLTVTDSTSSTTYNTAIIGKNITWVEVRQKIESDQVRITAAPVPGKTFEPYDTLLNYSGNCGFCSNECSGCSDCSCSQGLDVYGWDGTNTGGHTFGIIPVIQVKCDAEKFFCEISNLEMIQWAVLYAAGIDFMRFFRTTNRVNPYTIYETEEEINNVIADWENSLKIRLDTLRETLPVYLNSIDSCCMECNASTWVEMLP